MADALVLLLLAGMVEQLGSPSWPERERATLALARLDCLPLIQYALLHPDPEVRLRGARLLDDYDSVTEGLPPWLDMLAPDHPQREQILETHLTAARPLFPPGFGYSVDRATSWPEYRLATGLWIRELRRQGWSRARLAAVLAGMREREAAYWKKTQPAAQ